jgi:hypothetical protein
MPVYFPHEGSRTSLNERGFEIEFALISIDVIAPD